MKKLMSTIILINVFYFSMCNEYYFNFTTLAYGGDKDKSFINENDIIIIADQYDKDVDMKGFIKKDVKKKKEVRKTKKTQKRSRSLDAAYALLKEGKKYEARNKFSDLYFTETNSTNKNKIKAELDKLNVELIFSRKPCPDTVFYIVKSGDTLIGIASRFKTTYESIMRINRKNRPMIRIGERLKILNGEITLLVDKSDFTLTMLLNGHFIRQYPVSIGKENKTPEAVFIVKNKLKNPVWYSPEGVYKYGDPRNLLGTRWMGFEEKEGLQGYGIHGTTNPDSIGKALSEGCIRLRNEDVEKLYDFVRVNTKVVIQK